jgi:hypothetical protein
MSYSFKSRSRAANKAWVTRRARTANTTFIFVSPRSEAAKKAWVTRRTRMAASPVLTKQQAASIRASKAWKTRRRVYGKTGTFTGYCNSFFG